MKRCSSHREGILFVDWVGRPLWPFARFAGITLVIPDG
jgi:hypothetical protein